MEKKEYITASDLFNKIAAREKIVVLDIREKKSYEEYHVSGALHTLPDEVFTLLESLSPAKHTPVIVVSDCDYPASALSQRLSQEGYFSFYLKDGMEDGWFSLVRHIRIHQQK